MIFIFHPDLTLAATATHIADHPQYTGDSPALDAIGRVLSEGKPSIRVEGTDGHKHVIGYQVIDPTDKRYERAVTEELRRQGHTVLTAADEFKSFFEFISQPTYDEEKRRYIINIFSNLTHADQQEFTQSLQDVERLARELLALNPTS